MPANFQPASPAGTNIASAYGETQAYNQIFPSLLAAYEAKGRNFTQASAATAGYETQGNIASAKNQTERTLQEFGIDAQQVAQQNQIAAQERMQSQQIQAQQAHQFNQQAFQQQQINHLDEMDYTRTQNGITQVKQMLEDGTISDQDAADTILQLTSKTKAFENRRAGEDSEKKRLEGEKIAEQTKLIMSNKVNGQALELEAALRGHSAKVMYHQDGSADIIAVNDKGLYNVKLEHSGKDAKTKEEPDGGEWSHLGTQNRYDEKKGLADAKAFAEGQTGKKEGAEYLDIVQRRMDGTRSEFNQAKQQKQAPVQIGSNPVPGMEGNQGMREDSQPPSQQQPVQQAPPKDAPSYVKEANSSLDKTQSIFESKLKGDPYAMQAANELVAKVKQITLQYPSLRSAPPQVQKEYNATKDAIRQLLNQVQQ